MARYRNDADTICAQITPYGQSGVGVIRISGSAAVQQVKKLCPFFPDSPESHRAYYGMAEDPATHKKFDEVIALYFKKGKSFTGEETVEVSFHGNPIILNRGLEILVQSGCRLAEPGEFTYRAVLSGRIDLLQAENILSLIQAQSPRALEQLTHQLQGSFSKTILEAEHETVALLAQIEANIDFAVENLETLTRKEVQGKLTLLRKYCEEVLLKAEQARPALDGLKVGLFGLPNVGKSSLLNALIGQDRAIVSSRPGTTRDRVEAQLLWEGVPVILIDTAGLRNDAEEIEELGIAKTWEAWTEVDVIVFVGDASRELEQEEAQLLSQIPEHKKKIVIFNKCDQRKNLSSPLVDFEADIFVSAKTGEGLDVLKQKVLESWGNQTQEDQGFLMRPRQRQVLSEFVAGILRAENIALREEGDEFVAFEMHEALAKLRQLQGKDVGEEVLDQVFSEFCIGK